MKNIQRSLIFILLGLSLLWWLADGTAWGRVPHFFAWRSLLMQWSGVLGIGVMSVAMLLAVRPVRLEPWLGGLDKMYRLHKWLGIAGLVLALGHWLLSEAPKWLVGWGWLTRPPRGPRAPLPEDALVQRFLAGQRHLAENIGEWAFYAVVLMLTLALVKRFPYRYFFKTHRWISVVYVALVWHSVVLLQWSYWPSVLGVVMAVLMAAGTVAAGVVLLRKVGGGRKATGDVVALRRFEALNVLELELALHSRWAGHQAGQFAFVTLHADEGPHPFTISSAWMDDGRITFIIKALGDYTSTLAQRVQVGDGVEVEGPYGQFQFQGDAPRQIWIGAGIGITPFIARMQTLAQAPDGKAIDLFHSTAVYEDQAIALLEQAAQAANVRLHVLWDQRDGRLDAARITATVPQWRDADVWFCGPAGFGQALRQDLIALGLPAHRFHQELFAMR